MSHLNFGKKKYCYHFPKSLPDNHSTGNPFFVYTPLPLAESTHIGQLYQLVLQDTYRRVLEKKTGKSYQSAYIWDFSHTIYKALGYQTFVTEKLKKQQKQNKNKRKQLFIGGEQTLEHTTLSEHNLLDTYQLFLQLQTYMHTHYRSMYWDTTQRKELTDQEYSCQYHSASHYEIKFFVDGKGEAIATYWDIPYLFFSTVAIAVHPKDRRYKKYVGRNVLIPIINKQIPIIADEAVNMIEGQGAKAINPGHYADSIDFARRHHLPIEQYSITEKGRFTALCGQFAGEKVAEFKTNVIHFLSDIGNLTVVGEKEIPRYCNTYTGEELEVLNKKEYSIPLSTPSGEDVLLETEETPSREEIPISTYTKVGGLLPLLHAPDGETFIFSAKQYLATISEPIAIFELLVIHLVLEGRLGTKFSAEKCLHLLFAPSMGSSQEKKYESYLAYYQQYGSELPLCEQMKNTLQQLETSQSIPDLKTLLSESKHITLCSDGSYTIARNVFFNTEKALVLQEELYFHPDFLSLSCYRQYLKQSPDTIFCFDTPHARQEKILTHVQHLLQESEPITVFFDTLQNEQGTTFTYKNSKIPYTQLQTLQKAYGPDVARMLLLTSEGDFSELEASASYYQRLLQKIWNLCRFVFQDITIPKNLSEILTENIAEFTTFDGWIINKVNEMHETIGKNMQAEKYLEIMPILEEFLMSYFDHYLEIQKIQPSKYGGQIMKYCLMYLLQNIELYFPLLCHQIQKKLDYSQYYIHQIQVQTMEYKANILNDIIIKIQELKLAHAYMKHEPINVVIQCGPDICAFLKDHTAILETMIILKNIEISESKTDLSQEYIWDTIIDINVGIQKIQKTQTKKEVREGIIKQIEALEDEIQRKKILLGRILPTGNIQKIKEKKEEITQLKESLEQLKNSSLL